MISDLSAARTMCAERGWDISNLELQKLLYIAQMISIGRSKGLRPLIGAPFQAWEYGPVLPNVYHRAKVFGDKAVRDVFTIADFANGEDLQLIKDVSEELLDYSPSELVSLTHWDGGAWAKNYVEGVKGIVIPRRDILQEYRDRTAD